MVWLLFIIDLDKRSAPMLTISFSQLHTSMCFSAPSDYHYISLHWLFFRIPPRFESRPKNGETTHHSIFEAYSPSIIDKHFSPRSSHIISSYNISSHPPSDLYPIKPSENKTNLTLSYYPRTPNPLHHYLHITALTTLPASLHSHTTR